MHQSCDDLPTLVPCFVCDGRGFDDCGSCIECLATGLVPPATRQAQREAAGNPESQEQCDRSRS